MDSKPIWQSWTIWFNALAAFYAVLDQAGVIASLPMKWQAIIVIIGNVLLRIKTDKAVSLT